MKTQMTTQTKTKMISAALFALLLGACGSDPGAGVSGAAGMAASGGAGTPGGAGTSGGAGTGAAGSTGTGGAGTGGSVTPKPPATTVEETLDRLGRNVGDRTGAAGKPLPATFSPIGNQAVFKKVRTTASRATSTTFASTTARSRARK